MSWIAVATNQSSRPALWDNAFKLPWANHHYRDTEEFYQKQCDALSSYILLRDNKPIVKTEQIQVTLTNYKLNWINNQGADLIVRRRREKRYHKPLGGKLRRNNISPVLTPRGAGT